MRDNREVMVNFVNIIKRFPELYDSTSSAYGSRAKTEMAWENVVLALKLELNENSTVEELKVKWKGIRSSYNRYKNKLINSNNKGRFIKYYLYEPLSFLDPFVKSKYNENHCSFSSHNENGNIGEDEIMWNDNSSEINTGEGISKSKVKEEGTEDDGDTNYPAFHSEELPIYISTHEKSRNDSANARKNILDSIDFKNEDMLFFASTLPDIKNFTVAEKRKFKIGVLKLIQSIEEERNTF